MTSMPDPIYSRFITIDSGPTLRISAGSTGSILLLAGRRTASASVVVLMLDLRELRPDHAGPMVMDVIQFVVGKFRAPIGDYFGVPNASTSWVLRRAEGEYDVVDVSWHESSSTPGVATCTPVVEPPFADRSAKVG